MKLLKGLKSIVYEKKQMMSRPEHFEIEIKDDKNVVKYNSDILWNNSEELIIKEVSDEVVWEFLQKLFGMIYNWKEEYYDYNIIDGTEWKLEIKFTDGKTKKYLGKNAFPNNFEYLDKIKNEMIEKI